MYRSRSALDHLAGGAAGEGVHEVDAARRLEVRDLRLHVGDELCGQRVVRLDPLGDLHDGLDLFSHLGIGDADHRDGMNRGVHGQRVLDLLRIDVHPAQDDHERAAVGEVEIALLVDPADVAGGRPGVVQGIAR